VKLVASGDELRGQVLVADDAVRRTLESQLPELRHKLEAAGVTVQSLDVATDPNGGSRDERDERPPFAPPVPRESEPPRRPRAIVAPRVGALDVTV
jgi:flagellar hook-length control protein FliK